MSTNNICFCGEIRKILSIYMYLFLSGAMTVCYNSCAMLFFRVDRTETGHILGRAEVRGQGPVQERLLSPVHCSCLRLLTHMSMYLAAANGPQVKNQGPVLQSIIS